MIVENFVNGRGSFKKPILSCCLYSLAFPREAQELETVFFLTQKSQAPLQTYRIRIKVCYQSSPHLTPMCVEVGEAVEFEPKTFTCWINNKLFTGVKPLAVSPLPGCTRNLSLDSA